MTNKTSLWCESKWRKDSQFWNWKGEMKFIRILHSNKFLWIKQCVVVVVVNERMRTHRKPYERDIPNRSQERKYVMQQKRRWLNMTKKNYIWKKAEKHWRNKESEKEEKKKSVDFIQVALLLLLMHDFLFEFHFDTTTKSISVVLTNWFLIFSLVFAFVNKKKHTTDN